MQFRKDEYPTTWKKKFALFPTQLGHHHDGPLIFWEVYEERKTGPWMWERRALKGDTAIYVHTPATNSD